MIDASAYASQRKNEALAPIGFAKIFAMPSKDVTPFNANVRRIIEASGLKLAVWCAQFDPSLSIVQSTMSRIVRGVQGVTLDQVMKISYATGYAPWQLLREDFDPRREPPMMDAEALRVAAIYASIKDPAKKRQARAILETFEDSASDQSLDQPTPAPAQSQ
jgi:hypothetical protein